MLLPLPLRLPACCSLCVSNKKKILKKKSVCMAPSLALVHLHLLLHEIMVLRLVQGGRGMEHKDNFL